MSNTYLNQKPLVIKYKNTEKYDTKFLRAEYETT